ncbi:circadian clock protein KaiB [Methanothermobacter sp. CaT2]|uniref:circadian clock KaiB family protein n=1 Tax=Methanothermobacter TaxID=145260 RepID=UPI0002CCE2BC|nr:MULTISPECIES: circadian clock KaiB family protein [Methanothermobacter]WBF07438.1 circadian clock protein KaiB [Methanothermobacter thermautotrophicus]BAM70236.1 circadian clock protein KaiB [Methanothermobacter sp. CaT2]
MIQLRLYVTGDSLSERALENLRGVIDDRVELEVVNVLENPAIARENGVIAIPTLERLSPGPRRRVIGDLSDAGALRRFLGI